MAVVLFVGAHPDDETLAMGVAISEHVAAGHDVHVLTLNRSTGSVVRDYLNGVTASGWWGSHILHVPADEGYAELGESTFGVARVGERDRAVGCLRSGLGAVTLHEAGLTGGFTVAEAQAAILATCDAIAPAPTTPVWLKGHTYLVNAGHPIDDHPEHITTGQAIEALGATDPTRFGNRRHYVMPNKWADAAVLAYITSVFGAGWPKWDTPTDATISERVVNACRAYGAWAPPTSYAIGWHSVYSTMFAPVLASPRCLYHP